MTNEEIWKSILVQIDEDKWGGSFTPDDYNTLIKQVIVDYTNRKAEELYRGEPTKETLLSSKSLRPLIVKETVAPAAGVITLSGLTNTYMNWISMVSSAAYQGSIKEIKRVPYEEFDRRQHSVAAKSILHNPIATIDAGTIRILPNNIASVEFTFVKLPAIPFFDYYIKAAISNYEITYLAAGGSHTLGAGEVYRDGTAAGLVNSITVEIDIDQSFHFEIVNEMLKKVADKMRDQVIAQASMIKKAEEKAI